MTSTRVDSLRAAAHEKLQRLCALANLDVIARRVGDGRVRVVNLHGTPSRDRDAFRRQVEWVERHFDVMSPDAFLAWLDHGRPRLSRSAILFTFDDGLASNGDVAAPVLEERGHRGLFFVNPAFCVLRGEAARAHFVHHIRPVPDPSAMPDEDFVPMDPAMIADLRRRGHHIGNHSSSHADLRTMDTATMRLEIRDARDQLEAWSGAPVDCFAWTFAWDAISPGSWAYALATHRYVFSACPSARGHAPGCVWRTNVEAAQAPHTYRFFYSGLADPMWWSRRARLAAMYGSIFG